MNEIEPTNYLNLVIDSKEKFNIYNDNDNIGQNKNNNKTFCIERQEFEFINKNTTKKYIKETKNLDYNKINEIEKGNSLEINPYILRRSINNIKFQILNNKDFNYTERAKNNVVKTISLINIKKVLKEYIKKNTFKRLIKNLKQLA